MYRNVGDEPATKVTAKIGPKILGPDGKRAINEIQLFRDVEFFPAGKEFRVLVGSALVYFSSKQPTTFTAAITYLDQNGNSYSETITHNLDIYKDLPHSVE